MPMWSTTDTPVHDRARAAHRDITGNEPVAVASAAGTYAVIGEHVDDYGGVVIMGLSDLRAAVAYSPRTDSTIRVTSLRADSDTPVTDEISTEDLAQRAAQQQPTIDPGPAPVAPVVPEGGLAARLGGVVWTMIHRQLLSRDTAGLDITVVNDIPFSQGLGADAAVDAALVLALQADAADLDEAPLRARLAEVCSQATDMFSHYPALRARHTVALRGEEGTVSVVDYADGSVTQAPHPVSPGFAGFTVGLAADQQPDSTAAATAIRRRTAFLQEACRAYGTESLRLLPGAATRVIDWLQAVHKVHGTDHTPSIEEATRWLSFVEEETGRAQQVARALRSRRGEDIGRLLAASQTHIGNALEFTATEEIAQLCLSRGAVAARATSSGLAQAVLTIVPADRAENFALDLADDGLLVTELLPGTRGDVH